MNLEYDEIVSIEECGTEETIDITTDGDHLFLANNILTHNSGYDSMEVSMSNTSESVGTNQVADFIGALVRRDGDKEANKISLSILKNRYGYVGGMADFFLNDLTLRISDMEKEITEETESEAQNILNDLENM